MFDYIFFLIVLLYFNALQIVFNTLYGTTENQFNVLVCNQTPLIAASSKQLLQLLISAVDVLRLVHKIMINIQLRIPQNSQKFFVISRCSSVILSRTINMVQYYNAMLKDSVYYGHTFHHDLFNINTLLYCVIKKNVINVDELKDLQHDEGEQADKFVNILHSDVDIVALRFEKCACFKGSIRLMTVMIFCESNVSTVPINGDYLTM